MLCAVKVRVSLGVCRDEVPCAIRGLDQELQVIGMTVIGDEFRCDGHMVRVRISARLIHMVTNTIWGYGCESKWSYGYGQGWPGSRKGLVAL